MRGNYASDMKWMYFVMVGPETSSDLDSNSIFKTLPFIWASISQRFLKKVGDICKPNKGRSLSIYDWMKLFNQLFGVRSEGARKERGTPPRNQYYLEFL